MMTKPTLLDMTQEILSSMSSDEVNSISDSAESMQVAYILKRSFFDITSRGGLSQYFDLFKLDPSGDPTKPVLMTLPDEIAKVEWLKYFNSNTGSDDQAPGYEYVTILSVQQFIDNINSLDPTESDVESFDLEVNINGVTENYTFYYKNNAQPSFCTVIGNRTVIFNSYDNSQDSTLQQTKTMGYGKYSPYWNMEDAFIPELEEEQFPLLINEAKSLAFYELRSSPHQMADREAQRQWVVVSKNKSTANKPSYFDQLPNYGRTGSSNSNNWPFL